MRFHGRWFFFRSCNLSVKIRIFWNWLYTPWNHIFDPLLSRKSLHTYSSFFFFFFFANESGLYLYSWRGKKEISSKVRKNDKSWLQNITFSISALPYISLFRLLTQQLVGLERRNQHVEDFTTCFGCCFGRWTSIWMEFSPRWAHFDYMSL